MSADNFKTGFSIVQEVREKQIKEFCLRSGLTYKEPSEDGRADIESRFNAYNSMIAQTNANLKAQEEQERQERLNKLREEEKKQRYQEFYNKIPTIYKNASISDFSALREQVDMILNGQRTIILGDNDTGKTHLAWALSKYWVKNDETVQYWDAQVLLYEIKTKDNPYGFMDKSLNHSVKHLIIDEVDKIFNSTADYVYFNYLIKIRYEWNYQTILIGNGTKETFISNGFGQTVYSKMTRDNGLYLPLKRGK